MIGSITEFIGEFCAFVAGLAGAALFVITIAIFLRWVFMIHKFANYLKKILELLEEDSTQKRFKLLEEEKKKKNTTEEKKEEIELFYMQFRSAKATLEKNPSDEKAKVVFANATERLLEYYRLCLENYPTDNRLKYEYGVLLMENQKYDRAMSYLYEARKEAKLKILAMNKIGLCFFKMDRFSDTIDILKQAIEEYEIKDNDLAKELRYNLARAYEQNDSIEQALKFYDSLVSLDFNYKDVTARVDRLKKPKLDYK